MVGLVRDPGVEAKGRARESEDRGRLRRRQAFSFREAGPWSSLSPRILPMIPGSRRARSIMARWPLVVFGLLSGVVIVASRAGADEPVAPSPLVVREAVAKGATLVMGAASRYPEHRTCFSCHHQTMPMLAIAE